jgi:hypothetical protein
VAVGGALGNEAPPEALWQHYFALIRDFGVTAEPWGRDAARVKALLAELYRLGERPTRREVAEYLNRRFGAEPTHHREVVLELWSQRLRKPHARWRRERGHGDSDWKYPFVFAHTFVEQHGLESVARRLGRQAAVAASAYADVIEDGAGTDEADAASQELRAATHALTIWGLVLDRAKDDWYGVGPVPRPATRSERRNLLTKRGQRLHREWLEGNG